MNLETITIERDTNKWETTKKLTASKRRKEQMVVTVECEAGASTLNNIPNTVSIPTKTNQDITSS